MAGEDEGGEPRRLLWQEAVVERAAGRTPHVKSFFLKPPAWAGFVAGQHVDVRLTAPDGYQAERSYSIGSSPTEALVELVIEKLENGEVSPFFHDVVEPGDTIEMRGPIGGHFNWAPARGGPLLLIAGGSGVVPLMSMLRHRRAAGSDVPTVLLYSARRLDEVIFREELMADRALPGFTLALALTREGSAPEGVHRGRIDMAVVDRALAAFGQAAPRNVFVCGSSAFVEVATRLLIAAGVPFGVIRTERFGGDPAPPIAASAAATLPEE
jgi:ferredoxin-NADP reductase